MRHLKLMRAVAASGSLTKAGRELHLSQSALSHQLRDIESRLGTALFLRVGKRLIVTAAGARLQRSADEVLNALEHTEEAIHRLAGGRRGRLRVSSGSSPKPLAAAGPQGVSRRVPARRRRLPRGGRRSDPRPPEGRLDVGIVNTRRATASWVALFRTRWS